MKFFEVKDNEDFLEIDDSRINIFVYNDGDIVFDIDDDIDLDSTNIELTLSSNKLRKLADLVDEFRKE